MAQAGKLLPRLLARPEKTDRHLIELVAKIADGNLHAAGPELIVWRKSANAQVTIEKGGWESWVRSDYANTLTCYDIGGPLRQKHLLVQDGRLRTLTLTEWERLCGFPDGWTEGIPDSARFTALGNCVHVAMGEWLAEGLVTVMNRLRAERDLLATA